MTRRRIRFGVSYFGVRDPRHARADLDELAESGFSAVTHTFSEHDLRYHEDDMGRLVEETREDIRVRVGTPNRPESIADRGDRVLIRGLDRTQRRAPCVETGAVEDAGDLTHRAGVERPGGENHGTLDRHGPHVRAAGARIRVGGG